MNPSEKIKCHNCGASIDVNAAMSSEIREKLKAEYAAQNTKNLAEIEKLQREKVEAVNDAVRKKNSEIDFLKREKAEAEAHISEIKEREFTHRLKQERERIQSIISREKESEVEELRKSLQEKSQQVAELNKMKSEVAMLKMEKDEIALRITAEKDDELRKKLNDERNAQKMAFAIETERIKNETMSENALKIAELEKKLRDQTALANEMKLKAEQGSMQLQGEVQELAIEEILRDTFRFDTIEPVPKGVNGADVVHKVHNNVGTEVGIIAYESKRTKAFGKDWISKLKSDGSLVKADICVLVTESLPDGIDKIGQRDGVWICTFNEFKGLALVLRDSIIRVSEAFGSQVNKGEKMQMLYDYMMGREFSSQLMAIMEGFSELRKGYVEERNRMEKIWKTREKQLEKVLLNVHSFMGSIKGIAGNSLTNIQEIDGDIVFEQQSIELT
jgi:hypothetical protein